MAGYKITKKDAYYTYEAPGHKECKLCRLHDPQDIDGGRLINGLSHFLPSGGGTEFGDNAMESIYYIVEGPCYSKAMTVLRQFWKQVTAYISLHTPKNALQISVQQPLRC